MICLADRMRTGRRVWVRARRWRHWLLETESTVARTLRRSQRVDVRTVERRSSRVRLRVFHCDRRRWIIVFGLRLAPVHRRLVHVLREESFETLRGCELFDNITAIEATIRAITNRYQSTATQTNLHAVHRLERDAEQRWRLRQETKRQHWNRWSLQRRKWEENVRILMHRMRWVANGLTIMPLTGMPSCGMIGNFAIELSG